MLNELGIKYHTDKAYWHDFCNSYEKELNKNINELWEIGILDGASLKMWSDYYPTAKIIGYDIENKSNITFNSNVEVKILDQGNIEQLSKLTTNKNVDIIVDDGSHIIEHQIKTFEMLFDCLKSDGQYVLEDLHTSTNLYSHEFVVNNNKGALQYLNDIISNITPVGYPGQIKTEEVIKNIKQIQIIANTKTNNKRSITAIITHV